MSRIRINELARELEVKPGVILEMLPEVGIAGKKTHSSSVENDQADRIRAWFHGDDEEPVRVEPRRAATPKPSLKVAALATPAAREDQSAPQKAAKEESTTAVAEETPYREETESGGASTAPEFQLPRAAQPLRPPLASGRGAPTPVAVPPPPPPRKVVPAKPVPAPKPGQILSGPRQPLPPGLLEPGHPLAAQPGRPAPPPPRRNVPPPPAAPAQRPTGRLAGQPSARPVVPPKPELVERLKQQAKAPGMPQARTGGNRGPVPGQPIYRGPIRPGQPLPRGGPGGAPANRRRHPTSPPLEPPGPVPPSPQRRHQAKSRVQPRGERDRDREGKIYAPQRRAEPVVAANKDIVISEGITVKELSEKLGLKASLVIKKLVDRKIFATINQALDAKLASELASAFGAKSNKISYEEESAQEIELAEGEEKFARRPPVVTVMGHVDHGKTSLLDAIRESTVAEREAGGITQHIGAYHVEHGGNVIVFIDTPGHEAFTRMRARGTKVTDIVILVVAADDGVMPQTIEAIDHARAAEVPIIVAINKIDRPDAAVDRVKQQLADRNLLAEDWGGDVVMVPVSARSKEGLDLLLEMINLVSEMQDFKANPERPALGTVLEARLDRRRGPLATVLVRNGTLRVGDHFICGAVFGKVRALFNDHGEPITEAGPSMPAEVLGLDTVPEVGDTYQVVTDTVKAKQIVIYRETKSREKELAKNARMSLDKLHEQLREGDTKELNIILKADVGGSAEVITETLQKLSNDEVKVRVIRSGVGAVNESDVLLATASNGIIVGFNVRPERSASALADEEKVDIRLHTIIYELTDEIKKAMAGMLEPVFKEVYRGQAAVRETFKVSKVGMIAGCQVQDGHITRDSQVRLLRDNVVIHTGRVGSLRRFKDDVSEVKTGFECGIAIENFSDIKPGDVIEAFVTERVASEAVV